ncbi:MAG: dihydrolipoyl dehydrogenase [Bifidobacteriaceae bacterium]|nr:dihydrolipoyl dehydrogenase [Bifidobacteriaceae bacterium]
MSSPDFDADVVILGAGSAGYACALRAAGLGLSVTLIEAEKVGGTCLHRGCVPTKALLHAAEAADTIRAAPKLGVHATLEGIDIVEVNSFAGKVVNQLHRGLTGLLKARGVNTITGFGTLLDAHTVQVGTETHTAQHIVLATGARPALPPGIEIAGHVISSDQALGMEWIPRTAVILGGGVIGVEFASLWRSLGAQVAVIEATPRLLCYEDEATSKAIERALKRRGINIKTNTQLTAVTEDETGVHVAQSDGETLDTDILLVAVGRVPNTEGLGLREVGVDVQGGYVIVDGQCRTGIGDIWAIGDIVRGPQLAHRGFAHGVAVAERIAGQTPPPLVDANIPRVVYSDPEVASVGLTEEAAVRAYGAERIATETQTLGGNARSLVLGTSGMVKTVRLVDGPVLGIHLVGARVGELVGEARLIVEWEALPDDVAPLIHAHPTQGEVIGEALLALAGKPLHTHG